MALNLVNYLINRKHTKKYEEIFEAFANGRKKSLEHWFQDKWAQIGIIKNELINLEDDKIKTILCDKLKDYEEFCEIFILDQEGNVIVTTCEKHKDLKLNNLENYRLMNSREQYMFGPYVDPLTLDTDIKHKLFYDNVTLMFSNKYISLSGELRLLCFRVLNDDMSNVIQEEDGHIYKDSGDNYLFSIKNNRNLAQGTAISRSRFEDNTFTHGENLKDGVSTAKWGNVKIEKHTEFEVVFTDPATKDLHIGVKNTIKNNQNLDCWPGYPDYRHIMVGGKGVIITPPHSDETWGMMCEGDIAEIYNFKSITLKVPVLISVCSLILLSINNIILSNNGLTSIISLIITWLLITIVSFSASKRMVVKPLNKTVDILQEIAEGEGDLTKRVERTLLNLIGNAEKENLVFQETRNKFSDMTASLEELTGNILEVSNTIENTNSNSTKASDTSKVVLNNIVDLKTNVKETVHAISKLQEYSLKINDVVNVISDISKQTQLLSLNASIEAARAGESGNGFAVVASEISKLAQKTDEATKSISGIIMQVQDNTNSTFECATKMNEKVELSVVNVKDTLDSFDKINNDISIIFETMKSISQITSTQNNDICDLMNNVSNAAEELNDSTEKNTLESDMSIKLVKEVILEMDNLKQVLEYSSDNLNILVSAFKLS